ncbi:MAG: alpha/beta hydrolase, partial [Chlamydiia bacterium]|nr:alpha/beta hydrolase [Chlamydiia bacterium]
LLDVALRYCESEIPKILKIDTTNKIHIIDKAGAKNVFYHDCSTEIKKWASDRLLPQPYIPLETPLNWNDSLNSTNKRTYIVCENDKDVSVSSQRAMARLHRCRIVNLQCGHFPFLSHPKKISQILTFKFPSKTV